MWVVLIVLLSVAVLPDNVLSRNLRATDAIQHAPWRRSGELMIVMSTDCRWRRLKLG
jgi:hypothetical protein